MTSPQGTTNPPDARVREILTGMQRVAVVGISPREDRASHGISRFLIGQGLEVLGVNPVLTEPVLGAPLYASVQEIPGTVDIVDVFRRSEAVPEIVEDAIAAGAPVVWLQEGVVHEAAAARAAAAGLDVIMDRCLYKEWLRLVNG